MSVSVDSPDVFFVVLRYVNRRGSDVWGRMTVVEDGWSHHCGNCKCWEGTLCFHGSAGIRRGGKSSYSLSISSRRFGLCASAAFGCWWWRLRIFPQGHRSVQVSGI